jgi:quinol monooxygenase YgiN
MATQDFCLINKLVAKPGHRDEVVNILLESARPFEDNPSCILYRVFKDMADENAIWVEDAWTNKDDHEQALKTPEMAAYIQKCMPLLEGMPEQIRVEYAGGKPLPQS